MKIAILPARLPGRLAAIAPLAALVLLALSPFAYRAWLAPRTPRLVKIAVLTAFSGQLQARGEDLYAATQLAVTDANRPGAAGRRVFLLTALDDRAQAADAADQARAVAADPGVDVVLCCTTVAAERAVAPLLPPHQSLVASLPDSGVLATAEAGLAARHFGGTAVVLLSDGAAPADTRAAVLLPTLRASGLVVTSVPFNFAAGALPDAVARDTAAAQPALVVLDMDYPAATVLGRALRAAGVAAPLLGDERLDGASAAGLLAGLDPWWYVAPDRTALLARTPAAAVAAFAQARGHPPSSRDLLAYLQTRAVLGLGTPPLEPGTIPNTLYEAVPGVYPGRAQRPAGLSARRAP